MKRAKGKSRRLAATSFTAGQVRRDFLDHGPAGGEIPNLTPQELFAQCEEKARVADREMYERMLSTIAGELTFSKAALWEPDPVLDAAPSQEDFDDLKIEKLIHQGGRYLYILKVLKENRSREERWILLAVWLRQKGICEPFDFLPLELYDRLTREKRNELGISITDQQHYHRVEAWKPYFERLLQDRRIKKDLVKAGYQQQAIVAAHSHRAAVPAACEWLASSQGADAPALRNAHSRVSRILASQNP
jgi:hypothetical protein